MAQRVFALWSCNDLAAFDLEGNLLWLRGLTADYPNASNSLGMASSPIVIGETLVTMIENDSESYALGLDVEDRAQPLEARSPEGRELDQPAAVARRRECAAGRGAAIHRRACSRWIRRAAAGCGNTPKARRR